MSSLELPRKMSGCVVRAALNSQTLLTTKKKKFVQQIETRGDGTQGGFNLYLPVEGARVSARLPLLPVRLAGVGDASDGPSPAGRVCSSWDGRPNTCLPEGYQAVSL